MHGVGTARASLTGTLFALAENVRNAGLDVT
jgi:hypothetical protein